ncbi:helix-turn-helix domain-containing protein, partial [Candidatus Falkowbacteria bacterium]|nr:helix-turn-helix domain-containing protein [Candidatus Falkowbacteria bacterium]
MSYQHFKQSDRDEISILLKKGYSCREIADVIGKNHSSVSREIKANSARGIYDSRKAQAKARLKRRMSKYQGMKIAGKSDLEIK